MAWALIKDGAINRTFGNAVAFVHPVTGTQHPRRWLNLATDSELTAAGIIEITYTGTHKDTTQKCCLKILTLQKQAKILKTYMSR